MDRIHRDDQDVFPLFSGTSEVNIRQAMERRMRLLVACFSVRRPSARRMGPAATGSLIQASGINHPGPDGQPDQLRSVLHPQLFADAALHVDDGFVVETQAAGNFGGGFTFG